MPRPSKRVALDTLGGRLRAVRQNLHLSLAEVAGTTYSTSLISQIERNRVEPSQESLQYLAERLHLPLEELLALTHQHRDSEAEAHAYKEYEAQYAEIQRLFIRKQFEQALNAFQKLNPAQLPMFLRWRTLALRGQTYFALHNFFAAQRDFYTALATLPLTLAKEYQVEVVGLHLHLAAVTYELSQFEAACAYYQEALATMDASTPLRYVAEAHWGLALALYQQSHKASEQETYESQQTTLEEARQHAEAAHTLYHAIADTLNASLLQCQLAHIEWKQGKNQQAQQRLQVVLEAWQSTLADTFQPTQGQRLCQLAERANVVAVAACSLAHLAYYAHDLEAALSHIQVAIQAGEQSNTVRQAEALMQLGEILAAKHPHDQATEQAFRQAVVVLKATDRCMTRAQAHYQLARYLLSCGNIQEGQREIEKAYALTGIPKVFNVSLPTEEYSPSTS